MIQYIYNIIILAYMHPSIKILLKSCKSLGYNFSLIDDTSNNLFRITDGINFFFSNWYPINKSISSSIISDKAYCYKILDTYNFKTPKWKDFILRNKYDSRKYNNKNITKYAKKIWYPVFIKPNNWSFWKWAEVIYNKKELINHINILNKNFDICLVQKYIRSPEYRIFVVNWEIQFSYKRNAASIKWDGNSSINKLLKKSWNSKFKKSTFFLQELKNNNLDINTILPVNQSVILHSKTNISAWWDISELKTKHGKKVTKWVKDVVSTFDIWVTWIDIFAPKWINSPKNFVVIELNSKPGLLGIYNLGYKKLVHNVWKKILESFFWVENKYKRKYRHISNIKHTDKKKYKKIKSSV